MSASWRFTTLGEVVRYRKEFIEINDLESYKRCRVKLHAQGVTLRDIARGAEIKTKKQQVCRAGEFLVAEIDAKVGGFGIVPPELDGAIVSSHYFLFEIDESRLDRSFLDFYIRTPDFCDQVTAQGSTNYAAVRPNEVLGYRLPLPPLEEQRRIVARIEELATKIEEARGLRRETLEEAKAMLPSILGGRFQILAQEFGIQPLGEVSSCITDGPHKTPSYVPEGIPFVTVKNMVTGRLRFDSIQYITPEDHTEICKRCMPEFGDVLYSKDGATRGMPCLVDTEREFNIFVSVALIKPLRDKLDGQYLCHLLNSRWIRDRMDAKSRGNLIPHIVLREIKNFPVPLPPLEEQHRIVAYFDDLQTKVDALKRLQAETADELDALLPSVLDRAFRGEL